ncbi:hypothetical protein BOQ63_014820 [Streptomyces viridifaciens]|nr:hypothetical protein CP971_07945 [Streptomyces viridifaciens]UKZ05292.1 hypothetical protein BOQ63_014820 [Streptomyces viridifaciens]
MRRYETALLAGGLVVAFTATGVVGYLDWRAHEPDGDRSRATTLCGLPTGPDTPLGRLLPPGRQDVQERVHGSGDEGASESCTIRVDGRTALTVTADRHVGRAVLPPAPAQQSGVESFGAGSSSVAWARGAAVVEYCPRPNSFHHVLLRVVPGEAARVSQPQADRADFEDLAKSALPKEMITGCE